MNNRIEKSRHKDVSTDLKYVDHQGQKVAEEEDSNNTEQHPGQTLLSSLAPIQPVVIKKNKGKSFAEGGLGLFLLQRSFWVIFEASRLRTSGPKTYIITMIRVRSG